MGLLLSQACNGDIELFAVLGDGASCDGVASFLQQACEGVVGEGSGLVLGIDDFLERSLDIAHGDFVAALQACGGGEEPAQGIDAKGCLHPLAVADARDGGEVESCALGDVFQRHRSQQCLVAAFEERSLHLDDGLHGDGQRSAALLQGVDEVLCLLHAVAQVGDAIALGAGELVGVATFVGVEEIHVFFADAQGWQVSVVQCEGESSFVVAIDEEVRRYLLDVAPYGFAHGAAGSWIQAVYLALESADVGIAEVHGTLDAVPSLEHQAVEVVLQQREQLLLDGGLVVGGMLHLQDEAFLQVACSDAGGLEVLKDAEDVFQLLRRGGDVVVDLEFVLQLLEGGAQQSVVVEGTNEVADNFLLVL